MSPATSTQAPQKKKKTHEKNVKVELRDGVKVLKMAWKFEDEAGRCGKMLLET